MEDIIFKTIYRAIQLAENCHEDDELDSLDWEAIAEEFSILLVWRNGEWEPCFNARPDIAEGNIVPTDRTGVEDWISGLQVIILRPTTHQARIRLMKAMARHINTIVGGFLDEQQNDWYQLLTTVLVYVMEETVQAQADERVQKTLIPQIETQLRETLVNDVMTSLNSSLDHMRTLRPQPTIGITWEEDAKRTWPRVTDMAVQRKMVRRVEGNIRRLCRNNTARELCSQLREYAMSGFLDIHGVKKSILFRELNDHFGPIAYSYSNFKQAYKPY